MQHVLGALIETERAGSSALAEVEPLALVGPAKNAALLLLTRLHWQLVKEARQLRDLANELQAAASQGTDTDRQLAHVLIAEIGWQLFMALDRFSEKLDALRDSQAE
jgi:hypothetical protein